ncbi:MAG: hypothetical protein KAR39_11640 [Thermoplasmata archaeon]|nr:hypothetical protein [Thermoplasmata archaeon]
MSDPLRRHKYALNRILIPAARILSPEFNAVYVFLSGSHVELLRNLLDYATRETSFVDEYHDGYYIIPDSDDWDDISAIVASLEEMLMTSIVGFYDAYVCVRDVKPRGTNAGTFTSGGWRTRDINDEQADVAGICSIAGNQITLQPGTYRCLISVPCARVDVHQARLRNISDATDILYSTSGWSHIGSAPTVQDWIIGRFTLAAEKTLEIQHYCGNTQANWGFGYRSNIGDERYTIAEFWKET